MSRMTLYSRDEFRERVFSRDHNKCVFCEQPAKDAHHIMERRLFSDGGYYLNNGASVCADHHILCETTDISVEDVLEKIGHKKRIITPNHLYDDQIYDKWGNPVLPNGQRLRGELFFDESVQKIIKKHLHCFTHLVKAPRTYHLPWSPGMNDDDRMMPTIEMFIGKRVIVSIKMDGENTSMYRDAVHARSVDSKNHPSRNWVKQFWSTISHDIPEEWRIVGENMFAEHSIFYENLKTYFYGFQIWDNRNICQSWDDTIEWFNLIGIIPVEVLYDGIYDEKTIRKITEENTDWSKNEGYVIRTADAFPYSSYKTSVGKYVRQNHIQTIKHWMHGQPIVQNKLTSQ